MRINWQQRELNLKIVYYGPALSGKTTNLEQIHARVDPKRRSDLVMLKTHEDRTLFFDFFQLELGKIGALTPKIQLYTVPGQSYYEASRKLVLNGADGIVFVADSSPRRIGDNVESWKAMHKHLEELNIPVKELSMLVQFNKQDLPDALSPNSLRILLRLNGHPTMAAIASQGNGVLETFKSITRSVMANVQRNM